MHPASINRIPYHIPDRFAMPDLLGIRVFFVQVHCNPVRPITFIDQQIKNLPDNIVEIYKKSDVKAKAFADAYCDSPLTYLVASGNLEDWATCYGMCIMEEMQWMPTRPISAANFFHGTLEVITRDIPVILIKGEDKTRPLMDRVERFVNTVSAHVTVFDTMEYELKGISEEFRWILAPIVARSSFQRVSVHLEHNRRHPLAIRRYYRRLDY
jgi:fructoselysine-6-phosphate deglycase